MMRKHLFSTLTLGLLTTLVLSGCFPKQRLGQEAAQRMAGPAFMLDRQLQASDFVLTLYERVHDRGGIANIYIEGDDPEIAFDGMTEELIGLHLASRDKSKNVIYISRPCQFDVRGNKWSGDTIEDQDCDMKYLRTHRFAPEVIQSYHVALDEIKRRWGISAFNIYGHSGGGAIGALLTHERSDILSLTTVSGMMDHVAYTDFREKTDQSWTSHKPLSGSLNAADVAFQIKNVPQYHYIGGSDKGMPPAALFGYLNNVGMTNCVHYKMIQENGYIAGWVEKWPELLRDKPVCRGKVQPVIFE